MIIFGESLSHDKNTNRNISNTIRKTDLPRLRALLVPDCWRSTISSGRRCKLSSLLLLEARYEYELALLRGAIVRVGWRGVLSIWLDRLNI